MTAVAALALDSLDLTALEPASQATCVETMVRLLCSLEVPLQFVVRRRRIGTPGAEDTAGGPVAKGLDAAIRTHHAAMLSALPAFRSSVLAVMRHQDDAAALHRQLGMASEMLRSAGLRPQALSGEELAVAGGAEGGDTTAARAGWNTPAGWRWPEGRAAGSNWSGCRAGRWHWAGHTPCLPPPPSSTPPSTSSLSTPQPPTEWWSGASAI